MDGTINSPRLGGDRAWVAETLKEINYLTNAGAFGKVADALLGAIGRGEAGLGHPPPLSQVFWAIHAALPEPGRDAAAETLRAEFEAFHAIDLYLFQTLHCAPALAGELAGQGLTAARASTPVWIAWRQDRGNSPVETAVHWLDGQHRLLGLGPMFTIDTWAPENAPAAISQSLGAEILAFETNRRN